MSHLPDSASFHERVQTLFVAYRTRGLALSPTDVELLETWAAAGVPFEIVARGIRKAAEAALFDASETEKGLRALTACKAAVQREIDKYLKLSAGQTGAALPTEEPFHLARYRKLQSTLKRVAKQRPELAGRISLFLEALEVPRDFGAANRHEELALAILLHSLPYLVRRRLLQEARSLVQKSGVSSAAAKVESLRFHRGALVRQELDLPSFW